MTATLPENEVIAPYTIKVSPDTGDRSLVDPQGDWLAYLEKDVPVLVENDNIAPDDPAFAELFKLWKKYQEGHKELVFYEPRQRVRDFLLWIHWTEEDM